MAGKSTISIVCNGETRQVDHNSSLLALLSELSQDPRTVAVEYNGTILRREQFSQVTLGAGDRLEIVRFVQGGV